MHFLSIILTLICCLSLIISIETTILASEKQKTISPSKQSTGIISTDELVNLMNNKSWTTCRFIAELLVERGSEAIPPLI